jgi:hypothetical protein
MPKASEHPWTHSARLTEERAALEGRPSGPGGAKQRGVRRSERTPKRRKIESLSGAVTSMTVRAFAP